MSHKAWGSIGSIPGPPRPVGRPHRRIPGGDKKTQLHSGYPSLKKIHAYIKMLLVEREKKVL